MLNIDLPCEACNAEPGEPCRPYCLGAANAADQLELLNEQELNQ